MAKITTQDIDDIFGIPRDGSNIVDDDEDSYAASGEKETKVSFDDKANELNAEIAKTVVSSEKIVEKSTEDKKEEKTKSEKKEDVETTLKSVVPDKNSKLFDDIFGPEDEVKPAPKVEVKADIKVEASPKLKAVEKPKVVETPKEVVEKVEEDAGQATDERITANEPQRQVTGQPLNISKTRKHNWKLDAPSPKYGKFYKEKREALEEQLLVGGELEFDKYFAELSDASVNVSVGDTFVPELVCKQIEEVQKWRDRIKQIQLKVNRQYFHWESSIKMFDGLLRRIEYERGKTEGLVYEHLYDMEMYFSDLKSLYKTIEMVMKNLDGAFECLSRQVTITIPNKEIADRYNTGPRQMSSQLKSFDGLKTNANSGTSISSTTLKERPNSLEPKTGW